MKKILAGVIILCLLLFFLTLPQKLRDTIYRNMEDDRG